MNSRTVIFEDLGEIDYKECWDYQEELFSETINRKIHNRNFPDQELETKNTLIFCEHPHVYTLGKSGDMKNLLLDEAGLKKHQASFYKINRGGDITYHGPGQIVVYPIFDLDHFFTDIHKFLRYLEEAVIKTVAHFNIIAGRIEGLTGVWVDWEDEKKARKICALGVRCSRWVTMHGIAFNVNTDISYFNYIIPCGIDDKAVTSMKQELGHEVDFEEVKRILLKELAQQFDFTLQSR